MDMPTKDDSTILVELDEEIARIQLEKWRLEAELEKVAAKLEALEGKRAQYVESKMPGLNEGSAS